MQLARRKSLRRDDQAFKRSPDGRGNRRGTLLGALDKDMDEVALSRRFVLVVAEDADLIVHAGAPKLGDPQAGGDALREADSAAKPAGTQKPTTSSRHGSRPPSSIRK